MNDGKNAGCDPILTRRSFRQALVRARDSLCGAKRERPQNRCRHLRFFRDFGVSSRRNQWSTSTKTPSTANKLYFLKSLAQFWTPEKNNFTPVLQGFLKKWDKLSPKKWDKGVKVNPTFHIRMKNLRISWGFGERSSLHEFFKLYFAKSYKSSIIQQLIRMKKVKTSVEYGKSG